MPVKARDYRLIALPYYTAPAITAGDLRASALTAVRNPGFEQDLAGWTATMMEGNSGRITLDKQVKYAG